MIHYTETTARGGQHSLDGRPNQDALRMRRIDTETFVVAVADGHGSSQFADVGARVAVEVATHRLAELWEGQRDAFDPLKACEALIRSTVGLSIVIAWKRCVEAFLGVEAGRAKIDPRILKPFGSTLIAAIVRPEGAVVLQLGDGAAWFMGASGLVQVRVESVEEAIGDATESLSMLNPERLILVRRIMRRADVAATLMLATDGFQKSYPDDEAAATFLQALHARSEAGGNDQLATLLPGWIEQMATRGAGDDTTMALIHWPAAVPLVEAEPEPDTEETSPAVIAPCDTEVTPELPEPPDAPLTDVPRHLSPAFETFVQHALALHIEIADAPSLADPDEPPPAR